MNINCPRWSVNIPLIAFLVVWGVDAVMETLPSHIVLTKVDLPLEGLPIIAIEPLFMKASIDDGLK